MKKINLKTLIIILIGLIFLISCEATFNKEITASGTIEIKETNVSTKNADIVSDMKVDQGSRVVKGDIIAEIDHSTLDLQLKQASANLEAVKAQLELLLNGARAEDLQIAQENLDQAGANLESAKKDYQRMEELYNAGNISDKQLEDAKSRFVIVNAQYNTAQINLNKLKKGARKEEVTAAQARLNQAVAGYELLKKRIEDSVIKAPVDGIITNQFVEVGEFVNMGSPVYSIAQIDPVELTIYVNETNLGRIKLGQAVKIKNDSFPKETFQGKIVYISPKAEFTPKNIQTKDERVKLVFAVKIEIPNKDEIFKPGMPADAFFE